MCVKMLACGFGKESVVHVLEGTGLEQYSQQLRFGLYVVKGAVEPSSQEVWTKRYDRMMEAMEVSYVSHTKIYSKIPQRL